MKKKFWDVVDSIIESMKIMINKMASRTFLAWVVATHMTYILLLDPQSWMIITMLFLGIRSALDWKGMNTDTLRLHYEDKYHQHERSTQAPAQDTRESTTALKP